MTNGTLRKEKLCTLLFRVFWRSHSVANRSFMGEDLEVISTFKRLVPKKVNLVKVFRIQELEAIRLVPSLGENVETDLSTDRKGQVQIGKFRLHQRHHRFSDLVLEIKLFVVIPFRPGTITANGRNIEHTGTELNERAALDGYVEFRKVTQGPIDNALDIVFAQMFGNRLHFEQYAILVRHQAILRKVPREDFFNASAELFFLLGQIRSW